MIRESHCALYQEDFDHSQRRFLSEAHPDSVGGEIKKKGRLKDDTKS